MHLHRIDRRGKGGQDLSPFHRSYVAAWTVCMEYLLHETLAKGHLQFTSEYMMWYRRITCSLIRNLAHRHTQGYQPTAATVKFWGETLEHIFHHSSEAMHSDDVDYIASFRLINELACRALSLVSEDRQKEGSSDVHIDVHIDALTSRKVRGRGRGQGRGHASSSTGHLHRQRFLLTPLFPLSLIGRVRRRPSQTLRYRTLRYLWVPRTILRTIKVHLIQEVLVPTDAVAEKINILSMMLDSFERGAPRARPRRKTFIRIRV